MSGAAAVVERFQCYRCHDAPGKLVPAERSRHCVRCHQDILAGLLDRDYPPEATALWKEQIVQLTAVPSLAGLERHVRRDWLIAFLQHPLELRPELPASMPRLAISADDARAIADHFIPSEATPAPVTLGDRERGRALFLERSCASCHHFSGAGLPDTPRQASLAARLAPDLRHARERMYPATVLAWLDDPAAIKPDTLMPRFGLGETERRDLAAFLLETPLAEPPPPAPPRRLPLLDRPVAFEEVKTRVLRKVCWHCHSDPEPMGGEGGPGNTGGFGFAGRGLDLSSYEAVRRGGRGEHGERVDVLAPDASGVPLIVSVMLARHVEAAGGEVPGRRGMPLGLQPMSLEEIRLVDSWIAQGAKGP